MSEETPKPTELSVAVKEFNEKLAQLLTSASEGEVVVLGRSEDPALTALGSQSLGHTNTVTIINQRRI